MDKQPIDLHHLSAIRIGDKIVYNGVNGNAFSFGEKPELAAFALGPYPNPNSPGSPLTKSRTEPNLLSKKLKVDVTAAARNAHQQNAGTGYDSDPEESPTPTAVSPPTPRRVSPTPADDKDNVGSHKPATFSVTINEIQSSLATLDADAVSQQQQQQQQQQQIQIPPVSAIDKNNMSSLSPSASTSSFSKKKKAGKKLTPKEAVQESGDSKSQHQRNKSWGAITSLSTKIANSTSVLMTYTAAVTMVAPQRALPLPAPPRRQQLEPVPPDTLAASPSKESSTSSSSKSSSASSTKPPAENLPEKRARRLPAPPPASVGLPPILPRPPAAHLPPPLPSRPPAALRLSCPSSPCSSVKSSVSQRPSPDDDTDLEDNEQHEFDDYSSHKDTDLIYRSSGTIRLETSQKPSSSSSPSPPVSATRAPPYIPPGTSGASSSTGGRRHSQCSFHPTGKTHTDKDFTAPRVKNFSTISAVAVGTPGPALAPNGVSKSQTREPAPLISHQVSISTPNLHAAATEPSPVHSSDDEGVFEGANSSDTLSASENEVATPVPGRRQDNFLADQGRKKKLTKQQSLDPTTISQSKKSDEKKSRKDTEGDMTAIKNKKTWFFHKKIHETEKTSDLDTTLAASRKDDEDRNDDDHKNKNQQKSTDKEKPGSQRTSKKQQKKSPPKQQKMKLDNAPNCRKCRVKFGFRISRQHCHRCSLAFCLNCAPLTRCDLVNEELDHQAPSLVKLCAPCKDEILFESSRGATRGLWSEFQKLRAEARDNRGLDVTSSTLHKHLESQTVLDVTPGLRNLCIKFLVTLHQQLQKQPRHKFLANYLHFENPMKQQAGNTKKVKNCHACDRTLRITSDIRECGICKQIFCMACTWKTLQLYLPKGTDLRADIQLEMIQFHVKETEVIGKGEVTAIEATEVYRVCAACEDFVARNIHVYEFDAKVPELEAELFDLQRQIDHSLTFSPYMLGMQRSISAAQISKLDEDDLMATCMKHANRLYERYTRTYETLNNLMPQTGGQKALHKHIKQAMYDFYLRRRNQLTTTGQGL